MALWSLVLPFPPLTSHPSIPSNGVFEMLTANLPHRGLTPFPSLLFTAPARTLVLLSCHVPGEACLDTRLTRQQRFLHAPTPVQVLNPAFPCPQHPWQARYMHYLFSVMLCCCSTFLPIPLCHSRATSTSQGWQQISSPLISAELLPSLQDMLELNLFLALANSSGR